MFAQFAHYGDIIRSTQFDFVQGPRFFLQFGYHFFDGIYTNRVIGHRIFLNRGTPNLVKWFSPKLAVQVVGGQIQGAKGKFMEME